MSVICLVYLYRAWWCIY